MEKAFCFECGTEVEVQRLDIACPECGETSCLGASFAADAEKMKDFWKLTREEFLQYYPDLTKRDYAATIRDVGYTHFCDLLGWKVDKDEDGQEIYISQYSPAGEDFGFYVPSCETLEEFAQEVFEYWQDFDVDDHIEMWIEARRNGVSGVPTPRVLVKDAEAIDEMLKKLSDLLNVKVNEMEVWY